MKDQNDLWLESVYSDGTAAFVCPPCPKLFETVTIRLRFYWNAPVKHVFLRTIPNGVEKLIPMVRKKEEKGLVYYEAPLQMTENRMQYQFYLVCEDVVYFYTQKEITTYVPDHTYDFGCWQITSSPSGSRTRYFIRFSRSASATAIHRTMFSPANTLRMDTLPFIWSTGRIRLCPMRRATAWTFSEGICRASVRRFPT